MLGRLLLADVSAGQLRRTRVESRRSRYEGLGVEVIDSELNKAAAKPATPKTEAEKARELERTIQAGVAIHKPPTGLG